MSMSLGSIMVDILQEATSMRSALQAASANEKSLADRNVEVTDLKSKLAEMDANKGESEVLENKIASLESEIATVGFSSRCFEL